VAKVEETAATPRRLEALRRANEVRRRRAEIKRALRAGEVGIAALLIDPPGYLLSAKLSQLLLAVPGYGQVRVDRLLRRCRLSPRKTIGALSERQREELARALSGG
jgi:hypothetical protein